LVLFGASAYAAVALIVKSISATEGAAKIVLLTTASMSCMTLPAALMVWRTPELMHFVLLAGIGCCGTLGWLAFAQAFRYADASALAPYDFLRLPFVAVPAFILFGEVPDLWTWIGAAVIFGSSVYFTRSEARATRSA
jgi:drug/metabolite transporter (DMT)-like permease